MLSRDGVRNAVDADRSGNSSGFARSTPDSIGRTAPVHNVLTLMDLRKLALLAVHVVPMANPGFHRCWACAAPRFPPPIPPLMYPPGVVVQGRDRSRRYQNHRRRGPDGRPIPLRPGSPPAMPTSPSEAEARIKGEDMRTWLIAYELNIDVYICADRYMLEGFKDKISRVTIDMLESAGPDAAQVEVLTLCRKIYDGVGDNDSLLKMVFARVGFLQPTLWKNFPEETGAFLLANPEVATLMLKETSIRREEDFSAIPLPSMERAIWTMPQGRPFDHQMLPRPLPRGVRY